jgi:hypothetical protein
LRLRLAQRLRRLLPHALGPQRFELAARDDLAHELDGFVGHGEAEPVVTRREARHAEHAQRILAECGRDVPQ